MVLFISYLNPVMPLMVLLAFAAAALHVIAAGDFTDEGDMRLASTLVAPVTPGRYRRALGSAAAKAER
jgi:hypothetical protein